MRIYGPNLFKKHMYIWPEPNPLLHNKYMYMYDTSTGIGTGSTACTITGTSNSTWY